MKRTLNTTKSDLSVRQLAKELSLSPAQVHSLRRRGMPGTPDAARAWRRTHVTGHRAKARDALPQMRLDLDDVRHRVSKTKLPDTITEAEKIFAVLDELTTTAGQRARQLTGHESAAVDELGRRWAMLHADLLQRKMQMLDQAQTLRVRCGELIALGEVQEVVCRFLREMRQHAETMPCSMALRCNPSDPAMAQDALTEWVAGYFRKLHEFPIPPVEETSDGGQKCSVEESCGSSE